MNTELHDDHELADEDADFLAQLRQTYEAYPAVQAPPLRASLDWRRPLVPMAAAAAAAVVIGAVGGGALLMRADAPGEQVATSGDREVGVSEKGPDQQGAPEALLVPDIAQTWSSQTAADCSAFVPGPSPQVVFVPRFTTECLRKVPFGSSVIFSSAEADHLGGVDWSSASEPWVDIGGVQAFRKVRGEEFTISSTFIQGIWTDDPREYAVYVGEEAALAFETLDPDGKRTPDGASE